MSFVGEPSAHFIACKANTNTITTTLALALTSAFSAGKTFWDPFQL